MRSGVCLVLLLALAPAAARAGLYGKDLSDVEDKLRGGDWNERMLAVEQLGRLGGDGVPALKGALKDPDWQVRLTAVIWLGRAGAGTEGDAGLRQALSAERCPLVRLNAVHWLGRRGPGAGAAARKRPEDDPSLC